MARSILFLTGVSDVTPYCRYVLNPGKILTVVLTLFLAFDGIVSLAAVDRWAERINGVAATSTVETYLDAHFPDERMEKIYASMDFAKAP